MTLASDRIILSMAEAVIGQITRIFLKSDSKGLPTADQRVQITKTTGSFGLSCEEGMEADRMGSVIAELMQY